MTGSRPNRVRRSVVFAAITGLLFVLAAPANAGQVHKEVTKIADSVDDTIPAGFVCDFAVGIKEDVKGNETVWFDSDDNFLKFHVQISGTTEWSGPGGIAVEHWAWSGWFDPVANTFSQAGNVWNVHQNGLILHDKGLIIFDDATGDVIKVAGPRDVFNDGLGALCDAIG